MKIYRCGRMENILGKKWYAIQKRSFLGIWITLSTFDNKKKMENVAKRLERLGNVVIRMN